LTTANAKPNGQTANSELSRLGAVLGALVALVVATAQARDRQGTEMGSGNRGGETAFLTAARGAKIRRVKPEPA